MRKSLSLPSADDVTVECVAFNHMAMSRQIFKSRKFSGKESFRFAKLLPVSNAGIYFFLRRPREALYCFSDWSYEHCWCPPAAAIGCPVQVETGIFLQT